MTIKKALFPRDVIARLYVSGKEGRKELASIQNSETRRIYKKVHRKTDRGSIINRINLRKIREEKTNIKSRKQKLKEKQLNGFFKWQIKELFKRFSGLTWLFLSLLGEYLLQTNYTCIFGGVNLSYFQTLSNQQSGLKNVLGYMSPGNPEKWDNKIGVF